MSNAITRTKLEGGGGDYFGTADAFRVGRLSGLTPGFHIMPLECTGIYVLCQAHGCEVMGSFG